MLKFLRRKLAEREAEEEASWRLFRLTSMIAAGVVLIMLIGIDMWFRFASLQLNITIVLVAICFLALLKLDYWLHQLVRIARRRRRLWSDRTL